MPESALSLVTRLIHSLPGSVLVIDKNGFIAAVNEPWKHYGIASGLSPRFDWEGTNYFELMRELILPPSLMPELTRAAHAIFLGERLVYSGRFPKPPYLKGKKWFQIEAFPIPAETERMASFVLLSHRFTSSAAASPLGTPPVKSPRLKPHAYLPICASCKSVHKAGQWVPIERFLKQKLHVELTHDICPTCITQLYPQYAGALDGLAE